MSPTTSSSGRKTKDASQIKRRITQACILCRKKKIKCDGAKPECVHCQDANLQCQYTEYKKRGPHKGYVRLLEERLVQLERRLTNVGAEVPPPISINSPSQQHYSNNSTVKHEASSSSLMISRQENEDDDFPPPEIVTHLIDLFFQYLNSVFPFVHRARLKQSMNEGTVSKPLLWSVMAIAARFSDHPNIKTDPPYWAGEKFAMKATSLINATLLEPTIPNLQFWGIMSCLEYGRASGSKAWIYGGIAVRICQELGLNKEETLATPILAVDGSIDHVAMALRRRIFWSTLCIDKFASTSTNRPQGFDIGEYDVEPPTLNESRLLRDPLQGFTLDRLVIANDPLMDVIPYYLRVLERFGEIAKYMGRAKTAGATVAWPPINEFSELDAKMRQWRDDLPEVYQFTPANIQKYRDSASQNYINFWICSHAMYCTGMLALHRGSLAYSDLSVAELSQDIYDRIQASIRACKANVDIAMDVFKALRDICGWNVLPYMGYCAYIFSTVLMTSAFSSDPVSYQKSSAGLAVLFDTIKMLGAYWPMSERLSLTTRDMLSAHSRLYEVQEQEYSYEASRMNRHPMQQRQQPPRQQQMMQMPQYHPLQSSASIQQQPQPQQQQQQQSQHQLSSPDVDSLASISTVEANIPPTSSSMPYSSYVSNNNLMPIQPQPQSQEQSQQQQPMGGYQQLQQGSINNNDIDFNSCEFLYDSALFGQIIFDTSKGGSDVNLAPQYSMPMSMSNQSNTYAPYQQQLPPKQTTTPWGV
ncbi:conserved hypothetical protein [Mucor ambiguus]|uniref:Zn(2)-C6 fungal-type domain-containing protein n=1 Tax=Mucor ambiguus TaxID=91626 RepID=A0A0C9N9P9_9FUNG|nr:conserved hypothetical protein [Mucor ambiguus]